MCGGFVNFIHLVPALFNHIEVTLNDVIFFSVHFVQKYRSPGTAYAEKVFATFAALFASYVKSMIANLDLERYSKCVFGSSRA